MPRGFTGLSSLAGILPGFLHCFPVMAFRENSLITRRSILKSAFFGAAAVGAPSVWAQAGTGSRKAAAELYIPAGPLADIPELEKKTLTSGAIAGVDDEVFAPAGFEVRCVARHGINPVTGEADSDGYTWHVDPDGGAVYPSPADGGWVYVSNSEDSSPGGAGALRFDADGNVVDAYWILQNTRNNCAGGATPWGTWLSCEETSGGFVYECDPFGSPETAVRKPALGALNHEAAAIDPVHHVCYQTEDGGTQRFYRFVSAADDLEMTDDGIVRMRMESGELQVMSIEGYADGAYPDDAAALRVPRKVTWVEPPECALGLTDPTGLSAYSTCDLADLGVPLVPGRTPNGTHFASAEGIWYYELPAAVRQTPPGGMVPTRGVMFFTTKGDNRVWAYDIENEMIEIVFDNENMQLETGFNQVDNLVVSPAGDVLVAEDGELMRLVVVVPNGQARVLMQIRKGGSEITGPAFTPDGSRLYFSSQRGPSGVDGLGTGGATYELTIPPAFRGVSAGPGGRSDEGGGAGALGAGLVALGALAAGRRLASDR